MTGPDDDTAGLDDQIDRLKKFINSNQFAVIIDNPDLMQELTKALRARAHVRRRALAEALDALENES